MGRLLLVPRNPASAASESLRPASHARRDCPLKRSARILGLHTSPDALGRDFSYRSYLLARSQAAMRQQDSFFSSHLNQACRRPQVKMSKPETSAPTLVQSSL